MADVLLDTHTLIWLIDGDPRLGPESRELLTSGVVVHWSAASVWELTIKQRRGRFTLEDDWLDVLHRSGLRELPVTSRHTVESLTVEMPNHDPFDRLLVAQARAENLRLLTADRVILSAELPNVMDARH